MNRKLTAEERAAMKAALKDAEGEEALRAALEKMTPEDRAIGERIDAIVRKAAPELTPRTWYGMPAYANGDGKAVVFFRDAAKFKERYAMLGFNDSAKLDDGSMWPIAYALPKLTKADEKRIAEIVRQGAG